MKRIISTILCVVMMLLTVSSCTSINEEKDKTLKEETQLIYEKFRNTLSKSKTDLNTFMILKDFAKENNLTIDNSSKDMLLISNHSQKKSNKKTIVLQCNVSSNIDHKKRSQYVAIAYATLLKLNGSDNVFLLFSSKENLTTKSLPKEIRNLDTLINLQYSEEASIFNKNALITEYDFSQKITREYPSNSKAYRISFSNLKGGESSDITSTHLNPIVVLGDFIYSCKSSDIVFEIGNFDGGSNASTFPTNANATIVINNNDIERFTSKIQNSIEYYKEKYNESEPDMVYNFEEVSIPSSVLSETNKSTLISLLYTLNSDTYSNYKIDDDQVLAITHLGKIRTSKSSINLSLTSRTLDSNIYHNIQYDFSEIARLNDYSINHKKINPAWEGNPSEDTVNAYISAAKYAGLSLKPQHHFGNNDYTFLANENKNLNIISLGVNIQDGFEISKSLVKFLETSTKK